MQQAGDVHGRWILKLTGLSRTTASTELRKLALNPSSGITSRGSRSQKYYVLRRKD